MQLNTHVNSGNCDKTPAPDYQSSIGVTAALLAYWDISHPDFAWACSELRKYVLFPGKNHMLAT
jgi:hypothetical protein